MFLFSNKKENSRPVVQISGEEILTIVSPGLNLLDPKEIRAFVFETAPMLSPENLHAVVSFLADSHLSDNGRNLENLLASDNLARSFLAYQLVHDKKNGCRHFRSGGIIYQSLSHFQTMQLATGGNMPIEPAIPEIAVFLFAKENVNYTDYPEDKLMLTSERQSPGRPEDRLMLTSERQSPDRESRYLNAIDPFIIKYFVAELDENRKEQEDRRVYDQRGGYRAGRKVSVGLAVRDAVVIRKSDEEIGAIFQNALIANNITQEEFFDGSTRKFLKEPVYSLLANSRPANTRSLDR